MPTVLAILADGFEEIEAITPIDLLRRAGVEVTIAAIGEGIHVTGKVGLIMHADVALTTVGVRVFDCVFLPGGPGVALLRQSVLVREIVQRQNDATRLIAVICAAPLVLLDAGVLHSRRYTAHFSTADEFPDILVNERVVTDGHIITSRGAGTALDFGFSMVENLCGRDISQKVAQSICA
uniref:DJ-1 family glyoxalase III n=1 Tax=Cephaloticoccus sp. TaxID=1985742 RepID=UPI0040495139